VQDAQPRVASGERVPDDVSGARVLDASGAEVEVRSFWKHGPCLIVLLRQFGCVGAAEQVHELAPHLFQLSRAGLHTVLVGSGSLEQRAAFATRNGLEGGPALLVTDPSLGLYRAVGLVRSAWATFGLPALFDTARAMAAGHPHRAAEGDRTQQGGMLLVSGAAVVRLLYRSRSIGDHPPVSELVEAAFRLAIEERGLVTAV
jgi:hypothetical protein